METPRRRPAMRGPQHGGVERQSGGHRPRKRFAQNFLVSRHVVERLVAALAPRPEDRLLEIGPGRGVLSAALLDRTDDVTAIEIDRDLVAALSRELPGLRVIAGDALRVRYEDLFPDERPFRVVGNLPYNVSTPLLFRLLHYAPLVEDAHFMLQDEVVTRLTAEPGSKAWGRLGVMVQYHCRVERLFGVSPEAFSPKPQVRSRIVRLVPHGAPPHAARAPKVLDQVVRAAFGQRRKTLRNALKSVGGVERLGDVGVDWQARPETLSISEFVRIADAVHAARVETGEADA